MVKKHEAEVVQCSAVHCLHVVLPARVMVKKHEAEVVQCSAVQCLHVV